MRYCNNNLNSHVSEKPVIIVFTGALFLLGLSLVGVAVAADESACQCADKPDLQSYRQQSLVAIREYNAFKATNSSSAPYVEAHYIAMQKNKITPALVAYCKTNYCPALNILPHWGMYTEHDAPAFTDFACLIHINSQISPCMQAMLQSHEHVHELTCENKQQGFMAMLTQGATWKEKMTMNEAVQDEIDSYFANIAFTDSVLNRLGQCTGTQAPTDVPGVMTTIKEFIWSGTILRGGN